MHNNIKLKIIMKLQDYLIFVPHKKMGSNWTPKVFNLYFHNFYRFIRLNPKNNSITLFFLANASRCLFTKPLTCLPG